ncbi:MAG: hypothetical protein ACJ8F3_01015 [Xanthobacteraceae bacterium]
MAKNDGAQSSRDNRRREPNLDSRYGEIGISAVAAALAYQSGLKNVAPAPAAETDKWLADLADAA